MSDYLQSVESILNRFDSLSKMNDKQVTALRANITRTLKSAQEANDVEIIEVLEMVQGSLPEPKAKPAGSEQTTEDVINEYGLKYLAMSGGQRAAYKAKVTKRINEAEREADQETFNALIALQVRIENDDKTARRNRILKLADRLQPVEVADETA
jgi:hypothetical protein